jgi:ribonucleotide reductase alpha subunit
LGNQKQRALEKRILQFKEDGTQETELEMYERVANYLGDTELEREEFYNIMKDNYFLPNSPCLVNAGMKDKKQNLFACISGDTFIFTNLGIKTMQELQVGDKVMTHTGKFKSVTKKWSNGYKETLKATFGTKKNKSFNLCATPDHKILNVDNEWQELQFLNKAKIPTIWDSETRKRETITLSEYINDGIVIKHNYIHFLTKTGKIDLRKKGSKNEICNDSDFAFFVGCFLSNGNIDGDNIRITMNNKDALEIDKIKSIMCEISGRNDVRHTKSNFGNWCNIEQSNIALSSFIRDEIGLGFKTKKIPLWVDKMGVNYLTNLINGLMLDGFEKANGKLKLVLANPTLVYQATLITRFLGEITTFKYESKHKLSKNDTSMMNTCSSVCGYNINKVDGEVVEVFDIEVEDDHSFVAGDFYVHNCFVLPIEDNMESIFYTIKNTAMIQKTGGGTGFNFSHIRPKGSRVGSTNGVASGVISFMKIFDTVTEQVKQGGVRRGANMAVLNIDHPEILDFIKCKSEQNEINNFNLSVGITDEFIRAVKNDETFNLKHNGVVYATWEARYLFMQIMKHMHDNGEPGILFLDKINKTHKEITGIEEIIMATNPCIVGRTIIAVADGRNGVDVETLFKENKMFPVYSARLNKKGDWTTEIKSARAIQSGIKDCITLTMSDGSIFTCTPDHKIALEDGSYEEAYNTLGKTLAKFFTFSNKNTHKSYRTINSKSNGFKRQYRMIYEHNVGTYDGNLFNVDHKDDDSTNDKIDNLNLISVSSHKNKTKRSGVDNPIHRMDADLRRWINRRRNINANATKHNWSELKRESAINDFEKYNSKPVIADKNVNYSENIYVAKISEFLSQEMTYDLQVEDNHNFYIINKTDDNKFLNCSGFLIHNCGEIPLLPFEACCLGSINLSRVADYILRYGREMKHFYEALEPIIETSVVFLNKMLDKNEYPLPENKEIAMRNRKIGLGVMGYADMLIKFGLEYGSKEALELTRSISRKIQAYAHEVSTQLGYNNKCVNTVAPTGSISIIAECNSGIEPLFALEQHIQRMDESFVEVSPIVEWYHRNVGCMGEKSQQALKNHPLFKTANDIPYEAHIRTQDAWQQYIDNAVSKTINMANNATIEDAEKAFWLAFELSCKGYTIYRDGSRDSQVISSTAKESKIVEDVKQKEVGEFIRPEKLTATVYKYKTGCGNLYVTVSRDRDGKVVEVFTNTGKNGGCHSQSEALTRITAKALQNGVQHDVVKSQLQGIRCASCISGSARERGVNVLSCPDAISKALNGEIHNEVSNEVKAIVEHPIVIPVGAKEMEACTVCGTMSEKTGGCKICSFCGNSKCG